MSKARTDIVGSHPPRLGKYQILKRLAVGGMAEIYLARIDGIQGFEKYVVVKRTLPQYACDERFNNMFLEEAKLAAQLHHPNIVQVYDIGHADDIYFFAMEYVHGEDLANLLRTLLDRGEFLPLEFSLTVAIGLAAGLHYAHECVDFMGDPLQIIHRDVSPSNVLIGYDGGVKLVDFGIARAAQRASEETRTGTMKGKAGYMSPEQCLGQTVDRRSDVFSLGVLLYEMTTMTKLFDGGGDYLTMRRIVDGVIPPPSSRIEGYAPGLSNIVMKALQKDPDQRYSSAKDMLFALETFAGSEGITYSVVALSRYMKMLFGDRPEPWRELRQQQMKDPFDTGNDPWGELPDEPDVVSLFGDNPEPWDDRRTSHFGDHGLPLVRESATDIRSDLITSPQLGSEAALAIEMVEARRTGPDSRATKPLNDPKRDDTRCLGDPHRASRLTKRIDPGDLSAVASRDTAPLDDYQVKQVIAKIEHIETSAVPPQRAQDDTVSDIYDSVEVDATMPEVNGPGVLSKVEDDRETYPDLQAFVDATVPDVPNLMADRPDQPAPKRTRKPSVPPPVPPPRQQQSGTRQSTQSRSISVAPLKPIAPPKSIAPRKRTQLSNTQHVRQQDKASTQQAVTTHHPSTQSLGVGTVVVAVGLIGVLVAIVALLLWL